MLAMLAGCSTIKSAVAPLTNRLTPLFSGEDANAGPAGAATPVIVADTLEQAWTKAADECGKQSAVPAANTCEALVQRGKTLQCLATQFAASGASHGYPAPDGLAKWGNCIQDLGQTLVSGYYLRSAELERRTMLCHANLSAAPDARKPPVLTRLRKLLAFSATPDEEKRPDPTEFVTTLRSKPADLPKCEQLIALKEPMQSAASAAPAPRAATPAPVVATPVPPAPAAVVRDIESVAKEAPEAGKTPAPAVKKAVPAKKPAAKSDPSQPEGGQKSKQK